eukprot:scaffold1281_cov32-Phaeocystis_antarctica.AAC.1
MPAAEAGVEDECTEVCVVAGPSSAASSGPERRPAAGFLPAGTASSLVGEASLPPVPPPACLRCRPPSKTSALDGPADWPAMSKVGVSSLRSPASAASTNLSWYTRTASIGVQHAGELGERSEEVDLLLVLLEVDLDSLGGDLGSLRGRHDASRDRAHLPQVWSKCGPAGPWRARPCGFKCGVAPLASSC